MRDLILKNSEWYRGHKASRLLRTDGRRCCLGIDAKARGIPDGCVRLKYFPDEVTDVPEEYEVAVEEYRTDWMTCQYRIAESNDDVTLTDEERLDLLRPYFKARGINLIFDSES